MDMRIDESRHSDLAAYVVLALSLVCADPDDLAACNGDIPALYLAGKYIDKFSVFENDVRRTVAERGIDVLFDHGCPLSSVRSPLL